MTTTRRTGAVSAAALSGLAMLFGLSHSVAPRWAEMIGFDVWNLPSFRESLHQSEEARVVLLNQEERLFRDMEIAGHIANRLAEGTITLAEAIDQLEPQLAERPGFDTVCRHTYRVATFRQGVARYIRNRVARLLEDDPDRRAAVAARLEEEYAALK